MNWGAARWSSLRDYVCRDYYPSADEGIGFTVVLTVRARVSSRRDQLPPDPLDLVVPAADRVIRPAATGVSALRCNYLQHTIAGELAELTALSTKHVQISDVYSRVTLDDDAAGQAREAQRMRHELELDDLARKQARARARFIRDECLADPATARIYTLLEKSPRLGELAGVLDRDNLVIEVAQWHERARPVLIAQAVIDLFGRLTPGQSYEIVDRFINIVRGFGATELAGLLQHVNTRPESTHPHEATQADAARVMTSHQSAATASE